MWTAARDNYVCIRGGCAREHFGLEFAREMSVVCGGIIDQRVYTVNTPAPGDCHIWKVLITGNEYLQFFEQKTTKT